MKINEKFLLFALKGYAEGVPLQNIQFQEGNILFLLQDFILFLLYASA